jgi:hypothetical protein
MTATLAKVRQGAHSTGLTQVVYTLTCDTQYPANGYAVSFIADLTTIDSVVVAETGGTTTTAGQQHAAYDRAAKKIVIRDLANSGAQITTSTDLSNIVLRLNVLGEPT